ncbi:MAG: hypothetical protein GY950_26625 [bacterium]|nr:hypothetical protein [bacterium]
MVRICMYTLVSAVICLIGLVRFSGMPSHGVTGEIDRLSGKTPLHFIPNMGQVNEVARYYARASGYTLWLTREGLMFHFDSNVTRLVFLNARKNPGMVSIKAVRPGGKESKWKTNIHTCEAVQYKGIYNGIDLKVCGVEGEIEYDWIVKPGGSPGEIRFQYENTGTTEIDSEGNLVIETAFGKLVHRRPVGFQVNRVRGTSKKEQGELSLAGRIEVDVRFKRMGENSYGFEVGYYDKNRPLIIE